MTIDASPSVAPRRSHRWGWRLLILIPALWLAVLFLVPCLIVLKISLSQTGDRAAALHAGARSGRRLGGLRDFIAALSFDNYRMLGSDWIYLTSYLRSLDIATLSTALLLADRLSDRLRHRARAATRCSRFWSWRCSCRS